MEGFFVTYVTFKALQSRYFCVMHTRQKRLLKYGTLFAVLVVVYSTGLHKPIIATLQRGILKTGIMNPKLKEVPDTAGKTRVKGANSTAVEPGDPADLDVQFFDEEGQLVSLDAMPHKPYFINFWATWCPPCIAEMPGIANLYADKKEEVNFVLVSFDTDFEKAKAFKAKKGFDFPIYRIAYDLPEMYNTGSLPTTVVINAEGKLALIHLGMADYDTEEFREYLEELQ
ncbi:MAG: TlpA disulfide reductase family protein [Leeuwenhoekiella marinoflava]